MRLRVRAMGEEFWRDIEGTPATEIDGPTEAMAQIIGPGGAVIGESEIRSFGLVGEGGISPALKWGLIGGGAAVVIIVLTVVLTQTLGDRFVQPTAPMCTGAPCQNL